jgi:hypothetical protein
MKSDNNVRRHPGLAPADLERQLARLELGTIIVPALERVHARDWPARFGAATSKYVEDALALAKEAERLLRFPHRWLYCSLCHKNTAGRLACTKCGTWRGGR